MAELSDEQTKIDELTATATDLRWTVGRLELQLQQTRSALLGAGTWIFGLLLAASIFTPFITLRAYEDDDPKSYSLIRVIGAAFGSKTASGASDGYGLFFGVSFLVLLLVVLTSLYVLRVIGGRKATGSTFPSVTSIVLLLGTLGAWATSLLSVKKSWWQLDPGIFLLSVGAVGVAVLALWPRAKAWWVVPASDGPTPRTFRDWDL